MMTGRDRDLSPLRAFPARPAAHRHVEKGSIADNKSFGGRCSDGHRTLQLHVARPTLVVQGYVCEITFGHQETSRLIRRITQAST
jgi:hypothetical protein